MRWLTGLPMVRLLIECHGSLRQTLGQRTAVEHRRVCPRRVVTLVASTAGVLEAVIRLIRWYEMSGCMQGGRPLLGQLNH